MIPLKAGNYPGSEIVLRTSESNHFENFISEMGELLSPNLTNERLLELFEIVREHGLYHDTRTVEFNARIFAELQDRFSIDFQEYEDFEGLVQRLRRLRLDVETNYTLYGLVLGTASRSELERLQNEKKIPVFVLEEWFFRTHENGLRDSLGSKNSTERKRVQALLSWCAHGYLKQGMELPELLSDCILEVLALNWVASTESTSPHMRTQHALKLLSIWLAKERNLNPTQNTIRSFDFRSTHLLEEINTTDFEDARGWANQTLVDLWKDRKRFTWLNWSTL